MRVKILKGSYRNEPIVNQEFTLIKPWQQSAKGGLITVEGIPSWPGPRRINVQPKQFVLIDGDNKPVENAPQKPVEIIELPATVVVCLPCEHCRKPVNPAEMPPVVIEWGPPRVEGQNHIGRSWKKVVHQGCNHAYMKSRKS